MGELVHEGYFRARGTKIMVYQSVRLKGATPSMTEAGEIVPIP
jgi:hypothetical protein